MFQKEKGGAIVLILQQIYISSNSSNPQTQFQPSFDETYFNDFEIEIDFFGSWPNRRL